MVADCPDESDERTGRGRDVFGSAGTGRAGRCGALVSCYFMKIIFGLGNPGEEYQRTRHNVGFMAIQRLAEPSGCCVSNFRFRSLTGEAIIQGHPAVLALPQTFMNRCGPALRDLLDEFSETPENSIVVCDDFNLPLGRIRVRSGGSSGGHRGLDSVAESLGTDEFPRLKIGIGHYGERDPVDFVLGEFTAEETGRLRPTLDTVVQAIETWAASGVEEAMNLFNRKDST